MEIDDAIEFIIDVIRHPRPRSSQFGKAGYDITLQIILDAYMREMKECPEYISRAEDCPGAHEVTASIFEAAWELCRRGILRPSVRFFEGQHGNADGSGYSLTTLGRRWVDQGAERLLGGPDRISRLFEKLSAPFGPAFLQRASEAAHCHAFGQYVACCAMCGAAAESILLAIANAKCGDEAKILATYRASNGRRKVIEGVVGQAKPAIAEPFRGATGLLSYWRDEAAHGLASTISEIEAHEALGRLLRFAQFGNDNWGELTQN